MKRALLCLASLGCASLLAGCRSSPSPAPSAASRRAFTEHRVPESECRAPGPGALERAALGRDVTVLERLFERGYAGRRLAAPARWAAAHRAARAGLADRMSVEAFRDHLVQAYAFLDDNHVGFWFFDPERRWRSTGGHATPWAGPALRQVEGALRDPEGRVVERCEPALGAVLRPFHGSQGLVRRPILVTRERPSPLRCTTADGETRVYPLERLLPFSEAPGPAFEREGGRAVLRTLMTPDADALERFVASAAELRQEPVVLLDLRHTGGGADRYLARFFAHFAGRPLEYWNTGALTSETTLQGAANFWRCVRASRPDAEAAGRAWLEDRIALAERDLEEGMIRGPFYELRLEHKRVQPRTREPFAGRLLVAVGPECASACETAVLLARQIPGTWIVGQNTNGTMKVGELRWYRLPESKLWVALGRRSHTDPFGAFVEGRGFLPDVWVDGASADPRLAELMGCARDPGCAARVDAAIHANSGHPRMVAPQ